MKTAVRAVGVVLGVLLLLAIGGWLLLQRPDIPYATLEAKYAGPASQFMDLPGGLRVHYRDEGRRDGPTLVLVHGFSASLHAWEPWVKALSPDYRVITLDLPGHGLTRAPKGYAAGRDGYGAVIEAATTRLGAKRFVLAGNSMGGAEAWAYALVHPERLDGLVLVDAAGWPDTGGNDAVVFKIMRHPLGRALLKNLDSRALIQQGLEAAYLDPKLVTPALVDRYVAMARAPGHRDILLGLQTRDRRAASEAVLARIAVPTLVMHGRQDRLIPVADGERFAKAIPGATLILYDDGGHVPMEQLPDRTVADLRAWLAAKVYPAAKPITASTE